MPPVSARDWCRDVHAVAVDVVALGDHIAQMHPDAKSEAPVFRHGSISCRHAALDLGRTFHRLDHAAELGQHAVAHELDDAAAVARDRGIDHLGAMRLQARQRAGFVQAHQPAVAGDIGSQDGGEAAFHGNALRTEPRS
jgi:hypothetical protein